MSIKSCHARNTQRCCQHSPRREGEEVKPTRGTNMERDTWQHAWEYLPFNLFMYILLGQGCLLDLGKAI